jgi:bacillithiol biosynthesis deacetylase BshB1
MKLDILAIGVHPDDVELSCCGTLLKAIDQGRKVGLLDLTQGELGTRGNAKIREQEATESAQLMGALVRENAKMDDGFFRHSRKNIMKIVRVIRKYKPEIVLANALEDRHPDHARASKLTSDACFIAGLAKVESIDKEGDVQERWRPKAIYHYIQDYHLEPDFVIDITPYIDRKMELIMVFKSQFYDPNSKEPDSPISSINFMESIKAKNRVFGRPIGADFGEGFNVERTPGVKDLFDLL